MYDRFEVMKRFMLVAQTGSFTRAAERLNLPKSSISNAIRTLEKQLGTRLFNRNTRNVTLTQDGELYLVDCQRLLLDLEKLENRFQSKNSPISGTLRVDMPNQFAANIVLPNLPQWFALYPSIQLKISTLDSRTDPIKAGLDCVIRVGRLTDSRLIAHPLTQFKIVNCASPAYLKKFGIPNSLEDLQAHQLIDYSPNLSQGPALFEYIENKQLKQLAMPSVLAVNGTNAYLNACLAGLGIAQIPEIGVIHHLSANRLIAVLPEHQAEAMPVNLLIPSKQQQPDRLVFFIDWLKQLLKP